MKKKKRSEIMVKPKLTIIIPCYNMEQYIHKCLDSIFNQTFKNYNIIIIDDSSTDNTFKIIKEYEKHHENILVIENRENRGAGYSRNQALKLVKSDYVTFIDGDDYLDSDYYDNFFKEMIKNNSDIGICDFYIRYEDSKMIDTISTCCDGYLTKYNFIVNGLAASPCNKIFKTSLFKDNLFVEGIINEDIPAVITALIKAKTITYIPNTYYYYVQHKSSVQNSTLSIKKLDIFKSMNILYNRIKNLDYKEYWDGIVFYQIILLLLYIIPKETSKVKRKIFLSKYAYLVKKYNINKNTYLPVFYEDLSIKHKIYYRLLIDFVVHNRLILANNLIEFYKIYKDNSSCNVLEPISDYNIDNLIQLAKRQSSLPKLDVSVIIPNYNYDKFLYQRIYSILNQSIAIKELIILDDVSIDDSRNTIDLIVKQLNQYISIKKIYNDTNSGSAFKQWKKGILNATGKYLWVCEADDYCNKEFLKNISKKLKSDVVLAYTDTGFINMYGDIIQRSVVKDIDLQKSKHWSKDYITSGIKELNNYAYLNCTIANVSSVVFKNMDFTNIFNKTCNYKQAGDWLFYIELMQHGKVAYINKVLNYYRIHGTNATSLNKKQLQFDEVKKIHEYVKDELKLDKNRITNIDRRQEYLKMKWKVK